MGTVTAERDDAGAASGDLSLAALGRLYDGQAEIEEQAWDRAEALAEGYNAPEPPKALFYRGPDDLFGMPNPTIHHSGRRWFGGEAVIAQLRTEPRLMSVFDGRAQPRRVPDPRRQARANEIVETYDGWLYAMTVAEREAGITQASAEADRLCKDLWQVREQISLQRARSIEELIVKARVADRCLGGLDPADIDGTGDGIAHSIIFDLLALATQQEA